MLAGIAWKNIWRNRTRSLVIITAIALGLLGGLFSSGINYGMGEQMTRSAIESRLSDIQIHNPGFGKDRSITMAIPGARVLVDLLSQLPFVQGVTGRMIVTGMVSSPTTAAGIEIRGVTPSRERSVSNIPQSMIAGTWFDTAVRNPAVIGAELAKTLDVRLGARIVFTFQDTGGTITGGAFRIVGLFRSVSSAYDKSVAYVRSGDLIPLIGNDTLLHEIAVLLKPGTVLDSAVSAVRHRAPALQIQTWKELSPDLAYIESTLGTTLFIFMVVILLALAFGIINTMLMAVLERKRELGMLMAVGMPRSGIFTMIVLETIALSLTGAFIGIVMTVAVIGVSSRTGIPLSIFSQGLREFGIAETLYPRLPFTMYPVLTVMVIVTAIVAATYPAVRALRLKPADALRSL